MGSSAVCTRSVRAPASASIGNSAVGVKSVDVQGMQNASLAIRVESKTQSKTNAKVKGKERRQEGEEVKERTGENRECKRGSQGR